jgi:hypothetical protein
MAVMPGLVEKDCFAVFAVADPFLNSAEIYAH